MPHQRFEPGAIGISGDNALAVAVLGPRPEIEGLRKQPAGIEGHHVDGKPLAEDRVGDGLVLDAEVRREDDATGNDAAYRGDTVIELEVEARVRRRRRGGLGVRRWPEGSSDSLFEGFGGNHGFPRFGERG